MVVLVRGETREGVIIPRERLELYMNGDSVKANYYVFVRTPQFLLRYKPSDMANIPSVYWATREDVERVFEDAGWSMGYFGLMYKTRIDLKDLMASMATIESYNLAYDCYANMVSYTIMDLFALIAKLRVKYDRDYNCANDMSVDKLATFLLEKGFVEKNGK